eukprot:808544-Pyramimonas_sp.AAC.1
MIVDLPTLKASLSALKKAKVTLLPITKQKLWHRQIIDAVKSSDFDSLRRLFLGSSTAPGSGSEQGSQDAADSMPVDEARTFTTWQLET